MATGLMVHHHEYVDRSACKMVAPIGLAPPVVVKFSKSSFLKDCRKTASTFKLFLFSVWSVDGKETVGRSL